MSTHGMISYQPATRWQDALPTGNGIVGALVAGSIAHDVVVLNHGALWLRSPAPAVPDISRHLPEVRRLLAAGRFAEAAEVLPRALADAGYPQRENVDPYLPACALEIAMRSAGGSPSKRATFEKRSGTFIWFLPRARSVRPSREPGGLLDRIRCGTVCR